MFLKNVMASMEIDAQQLGELGSLEGIQGFHFNNLQSRKMRAVLVEFLRTGQVRSCYKLRFQSDQVQLLNPY